MLRVASYNVLADAYVRREYYPFTPDSVLDPARRRAAVVERVAAIGADVVCLQEVEPPIFEAVMARLGGEGRFLRKAGGKPDACAMFLKARPAEWREMAYHVYKLEGGVFGMKRVTEKPVAGTTFTHEAGKGTTRYWVVTVDAIGQEGQPSSPAWFGQSYKGFYPGDWHP